MTSGSPDRSPRRSPEQNRARLVGLFVLGVAVVLLVSSVTWFGSDQAGVGIASWSAAWSSRAWAASWCAGPTPGLSDVARRLASVY